MLRGGFSLRFSCFLLMVGYKRCDLHKRAAKKKRIRRIRSSFGCASSESRTTIHSNPAPRPRLRGRVYFSTPIRSRTVRVRQKSSLTLMTPPPVPLSAPEAIAFCTAGL